MVAPRDVVQLYLLKDRSVDTIQSQPMYLLNVFKYIYIVAVIMTLGMQTQFGKGLSEFFMSPSKRDREVSKNI